MAIVHWGIIARSESTGIQIRKKIDESHDNQAAAAEDAAIWQTELNTEKKFGLADWKAREDHTEGGPHEDNPNPLDGPAPQNPTARANPSPGGASTGLSGLLF